MHQKSYLVKIDKKEFLITEEEYQLLKKSSLSGINTIWFADKMISIPHISYIEEVKQSSYGGVPELPEISEEQRVKNLDRIRQIRQKLLQKN